MRNASIFRSDHGRRAGKRKTPIKRFRQGKKQHEVFKMTGKKRLTIILSVIVVVLLCAIVLELYQAVSKQRPLYEQ
jgi:hypothetical protein